MAQTVELFPQRDLQKFFKTQRSTIIPDLIKSYGLRKEEAEDCFQEGCIAVWQNIQSGKLTSENLTVQLSTYLNRCCRNHATHILQSLGRNVHEEPKIEKSKSDDNRSIEEKKLIEVLEQIIIDMPEPCNTILWQMYYEHAKQNTIAEMLNTNVSVIKVQKSRCMKKLKTRCNSLIEEELS